MIIVGLLAAVALPSFVTSVEQTKAQTAKSNLLAIEAGQQKYNEDHSSYCTAASCGSNTAINIALNLSIAGNDPFAYSCAAVVAAIPYNCTASDGTVSLTLNPNAVAPTQPVTCTAGGNKCPY